jgi:predicted Zn-dependent peptidase
MNDIEKTEYKSVNEVLYSYRHKGGLMAYVITKKGYSKKIATYSTKYGSIDNEFIAPGETNPTKVPDGIAHFLEHKLFEQKDGNVMESFSRLGSNPNAYTSFNQTVYLFSCTDRFEENFRLLLDFVQNPYITDESVEKEKGIIEQEIKMYQDDPAWRAYFNLLRSLYSNHPIRVDIAGTVESISRINKEILYKCYNTFYHPSNMIILVVGDVEPESVFKQVEAGVRNVKAMPEIKRVFAEEPDKTCKSYEEQELTVSIPLFSLGFKDVKKMPDIREKVKHELAVKVLLEMLMGKSSEFYNRLYEEGLINSTFDFKYSSGDNYAFSIIAGESTQPLKVRDEVVALIEKAGKRGLDRDEFNRIVKSMKGRFMRQFNSIEKISHSFISNYLKGFIVFDYLDVYDKITFEDANNAFLEHFNPDNLAMSVIKPMAR